MSATRTAPEDTAAAIRAFDDLDRGDVGYAGGKGANLGELISAGFPVPGGFVVGARAYAEFCEANDLRTKITAELERVDMEDTDGLVKACAHVRQIVTDASIPESLAQAITDAYAALAPSDGTPVAVRSSATGEDTASASFAGMNQTFLNVRGAGWVVDAVKRCWASLFGARTVYYRAERGLDQAGMDIAVVVQLQIHSTRAGVMFTIDPASGRTDRLVIEGSLGLGESVVSGAVSPDRYVVDKKSLAILERDVRHKELVIESVEDGAGTRTRATREDEQAASTLTDVEVQELAELGRRIESHYGAAQDTEWAFDADGKAWMLQSRPVTTSGGEVPDETPRDDGYAIVRGLGAAPGRATGVARHIESLATDTLADGEILVAHMTRPDWVPLMRRAAAIVTDSGGMTCHAAIVARELGIPCLVGTGDATSRLREGEVVTVDTGRGIVFEGGPQPLSLIHI